MLYDEYYSSRFTPAKGGNCTSLVWNVSPLAETLSLEDLVLTHFQNHAQKPPVLLEVEKDILVTRVGKLSLQETRPSPFGRILCRRKKQSSVSSHYDDAKIFHPPGITPFNFATPSPDDYARSRSARKLN